MIPAPRRFGKRPDDRIPEAKLALGEIQSHLVAGSVLACLAVLLFMRSWVSMIIAGVAIPVSIVTTGGHSHVRGPDLNALALYTGELEDRADELGIMDANTTLQLDRPELLAEIDRERSAALQVCVDDVATALRLMVGGDERVSRYRDASVQEEYDVQLRLEEADRDDPATIARLYVPSAAEGLVRVDNVIRIDPAITASRIDRLDRQRQVSLRAAVAPGYALADRLEVLRAAVEQMNLPPTYNTYVAGGGRELERTFAEFLWAFALSLVFVYRTLAAQYEKLLDPLVQAVMASFPPVCLHPRK